MSGVVLALVREAAIGLSSAVRFNLLLSNWLDFFLRLPCTVLVIEVAPFAEVFNGFCAFPMGHYAFDCAICLQVLLFSLPVQKKGFSIFPGQSRGIQPRLPLLIRFNIVIDTLQTFESLQELVRLVRVVKMGEVLPLDMKTLTEETDKPTATLE